MQWKDFFYFSHGERRALSLLLFLITGAWVLLNYPSKGSNSQDFVSYQQDTIQGNSFPEKKHIFKDKPATSVKKTSSEQKSFNSTYAKQEKFAFGTVLELNSADTTLLKKVPGIGSTFANRIIKYRNLLGGFYSVEQLSEVYGIDEERFKQLESWFYTDTSYIQQINLNTFSEDELKSHPYINLRQVKVITRLRKQKSNIEWQNLLLLEEFSSYDLERLKPYIEKISHRK